MDFLKNGGRPLGIGCRRTGEVIQLLQEVSLQICCRGRAGQSGALFLVAVVQRCASPYLGNAPSGRTMMEIGASIFFTEYSISPAELAVALEERGFDSLWVAEHSHIPLTRRFSPPGGGELTRQYYDVMDPFVTLSVAAAVTTRLKLA